MRTALASFSLDRMVRAVEKVRERLLKVTGELDRAGIPYAVAGGNAVAVWVTRVDEGAVRNTRDVDILIRREDLHKVREALEPEGFLYRHVAGMDVFLDGPEGRVRDAVHVVFAGEMVRPHEAQPNPGVEDSVEAEEFRVLSLEALVGIKLTAFRDKDRTHLRDLLDVGLIDQAWVAHYPPELGQRLQQLIDTPEG
jgi:hypothetical protein